MNSILQSFFSEPTFVEYLYTNRNCVFKFEVGVDVSDGDKSTLTKRVIGCQLLKAICVILDKLYSPVHNPNDNHLHLKRVVWDDAVVSIRASMNSFKKVIYRTFGDGYRPFTGQQDAHEFLLKSLEFMNTGLIAIGLVLTPLNYKFNKLDIQKRGGYKDYTIINKIYGGSVRTIIRCNKCNGQSTKLDVQDFIDESIALRPSQSVMEQLRQHFEPEELSGDNQYWCEKCKAKTNAVKYTELQTYPETFICTLKRFDFMRGGQKIDTPIKINPTLYINDERALVYEYGFGSMSIHLGGSLGHGHYVSFTKREDGKWYLFDDTVVRSTNKSFDAVIESKDAYVLFYRLDSVSEKK